jgi:hypothetical protein
MNAPDEKRHSWLRQRGDGTFLIMAAIGVVPVAIERLGAQYLRLQASPAAAVWRVLLQELLSVWWVAVLVLGHLGIAAYFLSMLWRLYHKAEVSRRGLLAYMVGVPVILVVAIWNPMDIYRPWRESLLWVKYGVSVAAIAAGVLISARLWQEHLKWESLCYLSFWYLAAFTLLYNVKLEGRGGMGLLYVWVT